MCYKGIYGKQHRSFVLNLDMSVKRFHVTSRPNLMIMNRIIGKVILVSFKPKIESLIFSLFETYLGNYEILWE